jgi:pyruvate ferredoxin oxidoreductase delta subunit
MSKMINKSKSVEEFKSLEETELLDWDEVTQGTVLFSFNSLNENPAFLRQEDRDYAQFNSYTASVADWRSIKPIYNRDICIDCQNCWIYCPDVSIVSRDKVMIGIDYEHCKGCGICVEVCPTNPKSLLMFNEREEQEAALSKWPEKKKKGEEK